MTKKERFVFKLAEELLELATVLVQSANKKKNLCNRVLSEADDVEKRLKDLRSFFINTQDEKSI
mgnify:CR=1 FL=1|jgi:hypothetical protein|tara:strand:+ start:446 stop:637 length:192 start_codon:yes stop_codon:yes gene_type:complete